MNKTLRIATWNIGGAHTINSAGMFDYGAEDLLYFAGILKPLDLDIICLQESHSREGDVIAEKLAKLLDLPFVFDSPRSPSHIDNRYQLANSIISKYPIEDTRDILLPLPSFDLIFEDGRRAEGFNTKVQICRIQGITFANTHLQPLHIFGYSWSKGEGRTLATETENVFLENLRKPPIIFAGDFNDPNLFTDFPKLIDTYNFKPALDEQPTDNKGKKVDYILYSPGFTIKQSEIVQTDKSDHHIGWVELEIKPDLS